MFNHFENGIFLLHDGGLTSERDAPTIIVSLYSRTSNVYGGYQ